MKKPVERKNSWHRSLDYRRVESDRKHRGLTLEVAFAELWEEENQRRPGINYGYGTLQDLLFGWWDRAKVCHIRHDFWSNRPWPRFIVTRRDAVIAATVVQWLGTNCGIAFLHGAFRRAGYEIRYPHEVEREARTRQDLVEAKTRLEEELARLRAVERAARSAREQLENAMGKV